MSSGQPSLTWRLLVDENLPRTLVSDLIALGHYAEHIYDLGMGGSKDPAVWMYAQSHGLTIITGDKDFSDLRAFPPPHAGIIVVEVPDTLSPAQRKRLMLRELALLAGQLLDNTLVIIEPGRVRIRR